MSESATLSLRLLASVAVRLVATDAVIASYTDLPKLLILASENASASYKYIMADFIFVVMSVVAIVSDKLLMSNAILEVRTDVVMESYMFSAYARTPNIRSTASANVSELDRFLSNDTALDDVSANVMLSYTHFIDALTFVAKSASDMDSDR